MKKVFSVILSVILILSMLTLCGCGGSESRIDASLLTGKYDQSLAGTTLNVYNWGEYISNGDEGSVHVVEEFEKLTGIDVNYTTYDSNESMYSIIKKILLSKII